MMFTARRLVATAAALLTVTSLGYMAWQRLAGPSVATGTSATVDGVTTEVRGAEWVDFDMGHVMNGQGGFMMPSQMMPDAPSEGEVRLGVTVTLHNTNGGTREFDLAKEFTVTGGAEQQPRAITADTIGEFSRLGPRAAIDGVLYFDLVVPDTDDPPLYLQWNRDGDKVLIEVPLNQGTPEQGEHREHGEDG